MKPPAFQFYADDFLSGVADMTQAEVGTYILLLCTQWARGEIPSDSERLALIAKGPVSPHVLAKFPNGKNARLEQVRKEQDDYRNAQSRNGKIGASRRWHGDPIGDGMATPMAPLSVGYGDANGETIANTMAKNSSPSPTPTPNVLCLRIEQSEAAASPVFPKGLSSPEFAAAWKDWAAYRSERRLSRWKPRTVAAKLAELETWGQASAIESIRQSIANGWQGIFEPKAANGQPKKPGGVSTYDMEARAHGYTL